MKLYDKLLEAIRKDVDETLSKIEPLVLRNISNMPLHDINDYRASARDAASAIRSIYSLKNRTYKKIFFQNGIMAGIGCIMAIAGYSIAEQPFVFMLYYVALIVVFGSIIQACYRIVYMQALKGIVVRFRWVKTLCEKEKDAAEQRTFLLQNYAAHGDGLIDAVEGLSNYHKHIPQCLCADAAVLLKKYYKAELEKSKHEPTQSH